MIYLDASVVFCLYFRDSNTEEALHWVGSATEALLVSALCEMETINAFGLRVFRGEMSTRNLEIAVRDLEADLRSGFLKWVPIPDAAFVQAKALSRRITSSVGVRATDLLHIAAALELGAKIIYTLDQGQLKAAQAAGLVVNRLPLQRP
jgi:predicted nucleic acid-binding protein